MKKILILLVICISLVGAGVINNTVNAAGEHTVAFDPDNGTTYPDWFKFQADDGGLVTQSPPDPTKTGYVFIGWASSYDGDGNPIFWDFATDRVYENMTLWAEYAELHTVSFDPDDGSPFPSWFHTQVADGDLVTNIAPNPTKAGYLFDGWARAYDGDGNPIFWDFTTDRVYENTTLWAEYSEAVTVTFNPQNNTNQETWTKMPVRLGQVISEPAPTPSYTGYTFIGWSKSPNEMVAWDFQSDIVDGDMMLYGIWEKNSAPVKPGGNGNSTNPIKPTNANSPRTGAEESIPALMIVGLLVLSASVGTLAFRKFK